MGRKGLLSVEELATRLEADRPPAVVELYQDAASARPAIPGAVRTTLHRGFAMIRPDQNLQYDVPTPAEFASALGELGITPQTEIVLADEMGNRWATRVYWLLSYYHHRGAVWVLDGGVNTYADAGLPTDPAPASPRPARYPVPAGTDESIRIGAAELAQHLDDGSLTLCDVRTPQEHSGEVAMAARRGHIPGSINVPWDACLRADGTFLPDTRLAKVLEPYLDDARTQVTYCQGGIRASLTWFALQVLLGRPTRMYAASWEDWAGRPELPVAPLSSA
jgi:thiosulfate/3-mercaptopyruvate sulfurtransferase